MTTTDTAPLATETEPTETAGLEVAPPPLATVGETAEELIAAQRQVIELTARVLDLEASLVGLRSEQIIDGADPRLERFWEKAGRIADHADYCDEYDRMAEALNGPQREREWDVTLDVTLSVRIRRSIMATSEEDARQIGEDIEMSEIEAAVENGDATDWSLDSSHAERA